MAYSHGVSAAFYYNMANWSGLLKSVSPEVTRKIDAVGALGNSWTEQVAGLRLGTVNLEGLAKPEVSPADPDSLLWDGLDGDEQHVFAHCPGGDSLGGVTYVGISELGSFGFKVSDGAITMPGGIIGSEAMQRGIILHTLSEEAGTGASDEETAQNCVAGTADGGWGVIICSDIDAAATLDIDIYHSTNGSDWSLLMSFTNVTEVSEEVVEVAEGEDVYQYLKVVWTLTSGRNATFFVAFARR